jgi:uncharacterized membrane protein YgcG
MKNMKIKQIIIIIALFLIPKISLAERITSFDSQMVINQDRSIDVTETITYDSEGIEKQGIYRKIALDRKFVDSIQVFRDDSPEPILITRDWLNNNINIRIGQEEVYFTGIRQYIVQYKYNNIIQSDNNLDILRHNITGNNWQIPIDKISSTIILPQNLSNSYIIQPKCEIIGNEMQIVDDCQINQIGDKVIQLNYDRQITPKNGLEINLTVKAGILNEAPILSRANINFLIASSILIIGLLTLFIIWLFLYKNQSIRYESVVQYTPPKNLSPAGVGYLRYNKPHPRLISALMISLARQGIIKIKQNFDKKFWQRSKYTFDIVDKEKARAVNYMGEAFLIESIFKYYLMTNNRLFLEIRALISREDRKKSTINILIFAFILIFLGSIFRVELIFFGIIAIMYFILSKTDPFSEIYKAVYLEEVAQYYIKIPRFIKLILNLIPLLGGFLVIISYISGYSIISIAILIIIIISSILNNLKPKRTQAGDEVMAYILGLEEYIVVAEKHRLDFQGKNYLFFEILPYAIALGHTKIWENAFEGVISDNPTWFESTAKYDHTFSSSVFYGDIIYSTGHSITKVNSRSYGSNNNSSSGFFGTGFGGGGGFGSGGGGGSW